MRNGKCAIWYRAFYTHTKILAEPQRKKKRKDISYKLFNVLFVHMKLLEIVLHMFYSLSRLPSIFCKSISVFMHTNTFSDMEFRRRIMHKYRLPIFECIIETSETQWLCQLFCFGLSNHFILDIRHFNAESTVFFFCQKRQKHFILNWTNKWKIYRRSKCGTFKLISISKLKHLKISSCNNTRATKETKKSSVHLVFVHFGESFSHFLVLYGKLFP